MGGIVARLIALWSTPVYLTDVQIQLLHMPALIIVRDHDQYNQIPKSVELHLLLPNGELAIIPGCGHVVLACKGPSPSQPSRLFWIR